ncbi:DUF167 domain-containing protein [Blastopirellula marina]|uniref:UPF0235 protein C5Y98_07330 n=1 Tax=Blastopirellula marina TaxID=124 RepID=A0A2S8G0R4_9BACT|nr:DUF167 domain-containing protein [Blastopirellula marina]PQO37900.1 DUF167 domain-containing protein [Blastopirellula marina]PTL44556.1 DUF167 domain-containing protein [Blastopirellula marina]
MNVNVQPHELGCVLEIKAQPGARKNELRGLQAGTLKVCVTAVAEKGKANKAIVAYLRKTFKFRGSQLEILSGETSSQKKLLIRNVSPETLVQLLISHGIVEE